MKLGLLRGFAVASLASALGTACAPAPDPAHTGRSLDEIQQLITVTDSAFRLVRNQPPGVERSLSEIQAAVQPVIAAVEGARTQIQRHSATAQTASGELGSSIDDQIDATAYSDVASCVRTSIIDLADIERYIQRFSDAKLSGDESAIEARRIALIKTSQDAVDCALLATESLRAVKSVNAVEQIGILTGEIYAIAMAFFTATGLNSEGLVKRQITANQSILTRLAPKCGQRQRLESHAPIARVAHPCVSYTLALNAQPKLRATLLRIASGRTLQAVSAKSTPDELNQLNVLPDDAVNLLIVLQAGGETSAELDTAVQRIATSIDAIENALLRQGVQNRINYSLDAMVYARTRACVESYAVLFAAVKPLIQRLNEAKLSGDEAAIKARRSVFGHLALAASGRCYFQSIAFLNTFRDLHAVNNMGLVVGEMYAVDTALHSLAGLTRSAQATVEHHIEAHEAIVARLAPQCERRWRSDSTARIVNLTDPCAAYGLAMDALPKLKSVVLGRQPMQPANKPVISPSP